VLLVVAVHSVINRFDAPLVYGVFDSYSTQIGPFDLVNPLIHGHVGVWIFFVISGYTMAMVAERDEDRGAFNPGSLIGISQYYKLFLLKRFSRIYPLFLAQAIFAKFFFDISLPHLLLGLVFATNFSRETIGYIPVMWSLVVEIQFYLIFPILYYVYKSKKRIFYGIFALALAFQLIGKNIFWNPNVTPINFAFFNNLPLGLFYFIFGMNIQIKGGEIYSLLRKGRAFGVLATILCLIFFLNPTNDLVSTSNLIEILVISILCGTAMAYLKLEAEHRLEKDTLVRGILSYIGRASYSIYLFHIFAIVFCAQHLHNYSGVTLATIQIVAGITFGIAVYELIEKRIMLFRKFVLDFIFKKNKFSRLEPPFKKRTPDQL
ncbi:MAG: acyltransferase, partial [Burkholderiales bacterium]|nr:acyltransferase [Burkholderiales bacterium]